MEQAKSVGIWVRVSTDMQGDSVEHHEQRANAYAQAKGWTIQSTYILKAVSGKVVMDHPETKRMLKDIQSGVITGLIFSKLARLARSTKQLLEFAEIFKEHGADLISLQESIDTSTPAGRLFYTVIAAMAQWEREEIASRVAASVPVRARLGKSLGGAAPFGYRWQDKRLVLDEKEAPIRRLMYELFLKVRRIKTTAAELNKLGHRTRGGSRFSDTTVRTLLCDPIAKGLRRSNYSKSRGPNKHWDLKPSDEWVFHNCPALISEEVWEECNQFLDSQYKKRDKPGRRSIYLLAGMVYCANCGKKMHVYQRCISYSCKGCGNKIEVADLDDLYYAELKDFLVKSDDEAYQSETRTFFEEKSALLAANQKEASTLAREMQELVTMRSRRELSPEDFTRYFQPLKVRHDALENTIAELSGLVDVLRMNHLSAGEVMEKSRDLYARWPELPFDEKRAIVELITERIAIGTDDVTLSFSYLPSPNPSQNAGTRQHINTGY